MSSEQANLFNSTDITERNAGMLRVPLVASTDRVGYCPGAASTWSWLPCLPKARPQLLPGHDLDASVCPRSHEE
jgi:hypothetical protein